MRSRAPWWLCAMLSSLACNDTEPASAPATVAPAPQGPAPECPVESSEDCLGCYQRVEDCCYPDDPDWTAAKVALAAACSSKPACAACCNECAAMSCDQLKAADACPNLP